MPDRLDRLARRFVPWLIWYRAAVLWVALAFFLAGAVLTALLYSDLRSAIEELLPSDAPSVVAERTIGPKLHNINHLAVILQGSDPKGLERFADALVKKLRALPPTEVSEVRDRIDQERQFARQYGLLFLSVQDLHTVLDRIRARVHAEKEKANPLLHLLGPSPGAASPPPLDFSDLEKKYGQSAASLDHFLNGYYQTPDGHLMAILIRPPENKSGYEFNRHLLEAVKRLVKETRPDAYVPGMKIGYTGEVASVTEEQEALISDLASSTAVVVVLVLVVLFIFFRRMRAIGAILGSLAVGCAITFGLSELFIGHLNANTAFLGSIVIGNGINVAIIVVARYREERRNGVPVNDAIVVSWRATLAATFVAAFAAALAYLSLATTSFRGFSQFGVIGFIGLVTNWITAYLLLPPLISFMESWKPMKFGKRADIHPWTARLDRFVEHHSRITRALSILFLAGVVGAIVGYEGPLLETNVANLRSRKAMKSGSTYWGHRLDAIFRQYLTPIVIVGDTPEDLRRVVAALNARRKAMGKADPFREVETIDSAIPDDQREKIPLVRAIRRELTPARIARLPPKARREAEDVRPPEPVRPVTVAALPQTVKLTLSMRNGTFGRIALAYPAKVGVLQLSDLREITNLIRGAIHDAGGGAVGVSQQMIFADIATAIIHDAPRATALALCIVLVLVFGVFRSVRPAAMVWASLLLGVAYLIGLAAAAQVRLNFLNFVVLPITFGIGVDYAVNIVQRYRLEGPGALARVVRETGSAVALCSSTTVIGYASLLPADNRALQGFGLLAALGEVTCLAAALIFMPAWLLLFEKSGWMFRGGPRPRRRPE